MHALRYNIEDSEISKNDFASLYEKNRRDSLFAFAIPEADGSILLGRDHLGNIPLFYRVNGSSVQASFYLDELVTDTDQVSKDGLRSFLALGTAKVSPLFKEIRLARAGAVTRISPNGHEELIYEYRISPRSLGRFSFKDCVREADALLEQAARRTLRESEVGLYLSGGIDSGLTGMYLKRAGASIRAYTAVPWGKTSQEYDFAQVNSRAIGTASHDIVEMKTDDYPIYAHAATRHYRNPCGAISQMAIISILENTTASSERQVYFAQNADTATCSVPDQSLLYFLSYVPYALRRFLHRALRTRDLLDSFARFRSSDMVHHMTDRTPYAGMKNRLHMLTYAGMRFAHSPVDGDIIILPAMRHGQRVSNLFYDMDVIEFCLGIPLRHRISFTASSKIGLTLTKKVFRELARQYLPQELTDRKKGLTVPTGRDHASRAYFDSLIHSIHSVVTKLPQHRFAAHMLRLWSKASPHTRQFFSNETEDEQVGIACSVGILTRNSARTLRRTLESVRRFEDIVVCDGGSNDNTLSIAEEFGARIIRQDTSFLDPSGRIRDYSGVRNQMLAAARFDWFLYVDSDEYLSEEVSSEIGDIISAAPAGGEPVAYQLPRKTVVRGTVIDCASVYPSYQTRFFHKSGVISFIKEVHERIKLRPDCRLRKLIHVQYVPLDMSPSEMRTKQLSYIHMEVERHEHDTFLEWLEGPAWGSVRSTLGFAYRHAHSLLFCRGTHMPQWVEFLHYWYNWKLFSLTAMQLFRGRDSSIARE